MTNSHRYLGYALVGFLLIGGCQRGGGEEHPTETPHVTAPQEAPAGTPRRPDQRTPAISTPQRQAEEFLALVPPKREPRTIELVSWPVTAPPTTDGNAQEAVWEMAPAITTLDFSSQRPITLRSVHTDASLFFLVTYPDTAPSETHKMWAWDATEGIYKQSADREDLFVFKWSLVGNTVNLALRDAAPHRADIWYWKAHRTNTMGYADDKWQSVSSEAGPKTNKIPSPTNRPLYLRRRGDAGQAAYEAKLVHEYQGDRIPKYYSQPPTESRADVQAKGVWRDGQWTIEFARQLQTGHTDDIAFAAAGVHLFGVSCYEMASGPVNPALSQPLYKTGDTFDRLLLRVVSRKRRLAEKDQ